jgi:hypothetical protein
MPRTNRITDRVFVDLATTQHFNGAVENFLNIDDDLGLIIGTNQIALKTQYRALASGSEFSDMLYNLAQIEEIIIQMRARLVIESEIRLSLSRNYIYARSTFYRRGNEINDIRVIIGKTDKLGDDFNAICERLKTDSKFMRKCKRKLVDAMNIEIEKNIFNLNKVLVNE